MSTSHARQIVLASRPEGPPTAANFRLEEVPVPDLPSGGVLLRTLILSLDPYMRGRMDDRKSYAPPVPVNGVMEGEVVAEVIRSDHAEFAVGDVVLARTGWRTHAPSDGIGLQKIDRALAPLSTRLGVLGMPGFTAYSGLKVIGQPKAGETIVVAAASGPVGSLVGQLGQLAGGHVVGIAGGPEKVRYLREELGFDAALDHRSADLPAQLAEACPKGIDVYFENVGGAVWQAVLPLLNQYARVPVCGLVSQYNKAETGNTDRLPAMMRTVLTRSLTIRGFINTEFREKYYAEFLREVSALIDSGRIKYKEDMTQGLENAPTAFMSMLDGGNFGKVLIQVAD